MGRKGRHRFKSGRPGFAPGGRVTPKGTRPRGYDAPPSHRPDMGPVPPMFLDILAAAADDDPIGVLGAVSSIISATDDRNNNPFERNETSTDPAGDLDRLVATIVEAEIPGGIEMLAGLATLLPDGVTAARCRRAVRQRGHEVPEWLRRLDESTIIDVVEQVDVLGDGDNIIIGVAPPGGPGFSLVVYVDHNLGHIVKDAFPTPMSAAETVATFRRIVAGEGNDGDVTWTPVDPATARARITHAIERGAMTWPRFETETWPASRPLVEWALTRLPDGGVGYFDGEDDPDERDRAKQAVTAAFWASHFSADLDDTDHRSLLESIMWFAGDYGSCDPYQWSPVRVEILLDDWLPRKVMAPPEYLAGAPELIKAFVRFCHDARGIRAARTEETLDAVDEWTPRFLTAISDTDRSTGIDALVEKMRAAGALGDAGADDGSWDDPDAFFDEHAFLLERTMAIIQALADAVGGPDALDTLDTEPLPDEAMDVTGIPEDILTEVDAIRAEIDRFTDEMLDVEYRTAARRLLAAAASGNPEVFRSRAKTTNTAAALLWVIGKANALFFADSGYKIYAKDIDAYFGASPQSARRRAIANAAGAGPGTYDDPGLGDVRYLVSRRRTMIITSRDRWLERLAELVDDD